VCVCVVLFAIVFVWFTSNDICPWVSPILHQMFPVEPKSIDWPCSWNLVEVTWLCSYPNSRAPFERKREKKIVWYSLCIIYNCTLAAEQKALSGPFVRWRHTTDVFTSQQIEYAIILKEKKKSRSIAQSFFFQSNKRGHQICIFAIHSELTH
jgi:hypothetical protein